MDVLIASDIFGRTEHLEKTAEQLPVNAQILDPYDGRSMQFGDEQHAYAVFSETVGLSRYTEYIAQQLKQMNHPVSLIGFSVGASAIWLNAEHFCSQQVSDAALFYSSQIRKHTHIQPRFPTRLVFPIAEQHFSVSNVMRALENTGNVSVEQAGYAHGFMNLHSLNFDPSAYEHYMTRLCNQNW